LGLNKKKFGILFGFALLKSGKNERLKKEK